MTPTVPGFLPEFAAPERYAEYPQKRFILEPGNQAAWIAADEFEGAGVFYLFGDVGAGKTHLAMIAADKVIQAKGARAAFIYSYDLAALPTEKLPSAEVIVIDGLETVFRQERRQQYGENLASLIHQAKQRQGTIIITAFKTPQHSISELFEATGQAELLLSLLESAQVSEVRGMDRRQGAG